MIMLLLSTVVFLMFIVNVIYLIFLLSYSLPFLSIHSHNIYHYPPSSHATLLITLSYVYLVEVVLIYTPNTGSLMNNPAYYIYSGHMLIVVTLILNNIILLHHIMYQY